MSDAWLLFIISSVFGASVLFAANAFIRAGTRHREEQLRRELPLTVDEEQRPSTIPVREDAKADANFSLLGIAAGGAVVFFVFSWAGLTALAAFGGVLVYFIIAVPVTLWLRARRLKRQGSDQQADDTPRH